MTGWIDDGEPLAVHLTWRGASKKPAERPFGHNRSMTLRTPRATMVVPALVALGLSACMGTVPSPSGPTPMPIASPLGAFPSELADGLRTAVDVPYTDVTVCGADPCRVPGDVLAPADGTALPTIVLLNGGGKLFTERRYQAPLAVELANRGAVVFLMAYRGMSTGSSRIEDGLNDARCAIRYPRAHTEEYGGDPERLVVVGHSQGGFMAIDIANPEADAEACLAGGSAIPDGVVALGSPRPSAFGAAETGPPLWLFSGSEDRPAEAYALLLRDNGFDAVSEVLPGVTHDGITDPAAAPEIVDLIMGAVESI